MIKQGPGLLPIAFNKGPIRMLYHIHLKRGKGGEEGGERRGERRERWRERGVWLQKDLSTWGTIDTKERERER